MNRKHIVFFILGGFFITNAVVAELIAGKIFSVDIPLFFQTFLQWIKVYKTEFIVSVGVIPWPIVFVATDLVNEFFGRKGVRFYTFVTIGLIFYTFIILALARQVSAASFSPVSEQSFNNVFGMSQWIIVGSLTAFLVSQLIDVVGFRFIRLRTGSHHLWARATGSTIVSQLIDTFVVGGIAFYLPGYFTLDQYLQVSITAYFYKVGIAIVITPLCYLGHWLISLYLGKEEAKRLAEEATHPK